MKSTRQSKTDKIVISHKSCQRERISLWNDLLVTRITVFERELALLVAIQEESIWKGSA